MVKKQTKTKNLLEIGIAKRLGELLDITFKHLSLEFCFCASSSYARSTVKQLCDVRDVSLWRKENEDGM